MVANPKRQALVELSDYVSRQNDLLGFKTNFPASDMMNILAVGSKASEFSSAVNAEDTWIGPLADTQAEDTKTDVAAVDTVFSDLLDEINALIRVMPEDLDENDPDVNWPNWTDWDNIPH